MKVPKIQESDVKSSFRIFELFLFVIVCILIISIFATYNSIYNEHKNNSVNRAVSELLHLPIGTVNGDWIFYNDVFELDQMAQIEYPDEDHFSYAFDAVVREKLLNQLANELGVSTEFSYAEVSDEDYKVYGWSLDDYKKHVLFPMTLSSVLQDSVLSDQSCQQDVLMEMENILSLLENGIAFSDIAIQYSQVASSQFGGDVGWMEHDDFEEGLLEVWEYEVGDRSGILELNDSFVIAQVYDVVELDEVRELVGVQMIVLYKNELSEVLSQKKETSEIKMF